MDQTRPNDITPPLDQILADVPGAERLVAVDEDAVVVRQAGGPVAFDTGVSIVRLWEAAARAAATRSPSPLDHVVVRIVIGSIVVVCCPGGLLAALGRTGVRPDRVAYELRKAASGYRIAPDGRPSAGERS